MAKLFQAYLFAILKQWCAVGLQKYLLKKDYVADSAVTMAMYTD